MPNYEKQCKELLLDDVVEIAVFVDAEGNVETSSDSIKIS